LVVAIIRNKYYWVPRLPQLISIRFCFHIHVLYSLFLFYIYIAIQSNLKLDGMKLLYCDWMGVATKNSQILCCSLLFKFPIGGLWVHSHDKREMFWVRFSIHWYWILVCWESIREFPI